MPKPRKIDIFYDGSCSVCARFVEAVQSGGSRKFHAHDITKGNLPEGTTFSEAWKHMYVITPEGEKLRGGRAIVRLLSEAPRWRALSYILSLPLVRDCVEIGYDILASHRHRIPWRSRS